MKNLFLTSMLASAVVATPLMAQTSAPSEPASPAPTTPAPAAPDPMTDGVTDGVTVPEILAPEGFTREDIALTAEDLLGATIYDPAGDSIGEVHDLVLDVSPSGAGAAPNASSPPNAAGTTTGTGTATGTEPGTAAGQPTHAVLDIGGFLGMGEHRIAVPISDLAIYRSNSDTRVYLPWARAQLEALPAYDANDPATLGRANSPMAD